MAFPRSSRSDSIDERALQPSRVGPSIAGLIAVAAVASALSLGTELAHGTSASGKAVARMSRVTAPLSAASEPRPTMTSRTSEAPTASRVVRPVREEERCSAHAPAERDADRLTEDQVRRLRELDLARRLRGDNRRKGRATSRTSLMPPVPGAATSDPFSRGGSPFDPLNGAF